LGHLHSGEDAGPPPGIIANQEKGSVEERFSASHAPSPLGGAARRTPGFFSIIMPSLQMPVQWRFFLAI